MQSFAAETRTIPVHRFEGEIEGYVTNHMTRNFWRVRRTMERDDVMQEARLVFLKVSGKYPAVEPRHLMALFKTSWARRFTDMANADTRHRELVVESICVLEDEHDGVDSDDNPRGWNPHRAVGETDNAGMLRIMVRQAPKEVKTVLALFVNAPGELLDAAVSTWHEDKRRKGNPSEGICRMLGLPLDRDVMEDTRRYFS